MNHFENEMNNKDALWASADLRRFALVCGLKDGIGLRSVSGLSENSSES